MNNHEKIVWSDKFSIGNQDIDIVHKNLIDIFNDLIDLIESNGCRENFALCLSKMTDYCLMHFKKEEEYMKRFSYPDFQKHKNCHKDYIYKVAMYNIELLGADPPDFLEVVEFLNRWWTHHILKSDKKYEDYKKEINSLAKY